MKKPHLVLFLGLLTLFSLDSTVYAQDNTGIIELVNKKATEHNVPVALAQAVIQLESNYNTHVTGVRGEYGLGQIRCSTAKSLGMVGKCDKLNDPETNLEYSMSYLKEGIDISNGDIRMAVNYYASGKAGISMNTRYYKEIMKRLL